MSEHDTDCLPMGQPIHPMCPALMKDSGERQSFDTGAVRDTAEGKPRPVLMSPFAIKRLAHWLRLGAKKYTERNWEKGIPVSRCLDSLERHVLAFKEGLKDEDHLAAVMCNAMFIMHYEEMMARGILPESVNDMPDYKAKTVGKPSSDSHYDLYNC